MENDPAREWQRMQEVYAQMSDDELQNVADEAYELTEIAKQALAAEIKTRGADVQLRLEPPANDESEPEVEDLGEESEHSDPGEYELVKVRDLRDEEEARTAKWVLDNAGIPAWIGSQNVETVDEYKGSFEKGVSLKVRRVDAGAATLAFVHHWPADPSDTSQPDLPEAEVRCPKCHSDEVVFESLEGERTDDTTLGSKFNWHCDACGHDWQDEGIEQEA